MSITNPLIEPDHIAEKVLRRVEIAKVARNLQDCLAFASFKAQNGLQNRTLRTIEPEFTEQLKRKRPHSADDLRSDSSTNSPKKDYAQNSVHMGMSFTNESLPTQDSDPFQAPVPRKRIRSSTMVGQTLHQPVSLSWKQTYNLPQSSPVMQRPHTVASHENPSFISDTATIPDSNPESSPLFDIHQASDDEDNDLPMHSFQIHASSSIVSSSPPRTPPPARGVQAGTTKQAGADLLLYLANSPSRSPAVKATHIPSTSLNPPSTPPSQHTHLPSSIMNTPGTNLGLFNGAFQTPGQNFNFADFVNVTPSPAQVNWGGRTPGMAKTPHLTRRGLNFDNLLPPSSSPNLQRKTPNQRGLALELGEELIPR